MNRTDLHQLADTRLREAQALLAAGEYSGAFYLAGYALECALKARIASFTQRHDFPDKRKVLESYTHSLELLIKAARLQPELKLRLEEDPIFAASWAFTKNWNEETRYRHFTQDEAEELVASIDDEEHGVLTWLKLFW